MKRLREQPPTRTSVAAEDFLEFCQQFCKTDQDHFGEPLRMAPYNFQTKTFYKFFGSNGLRVLREMGSARRLPAIATFKQIKRLGGHLRKGSHAVARVVSYAPNKQARRAEARDVTQTREERLEAARFPTWTAVFHLDDCEWPSEEVRQQVLGDVYRARGFWHLSQSEHRQWRGLLKKGPEEKEPFRSLQQLCVERLVQSSLERGEELALPIVPPPGWWPLLGDGYGDHFLAQLAEKQEPGERWNYTEEGTLIVPLRASFPTPSAYYNAGYAALARGLCGGDEVKALLLWRRLVQESRMPFELTGAAALAFWPDPEKENFYSLERYHKQRTAFLKTVQALTTDQLAARIKEVDAYFSV